MELVDPTRSTIWMEDGNIVLQSENTLFRVHRSVLSRNSSVFRDMFELSSIDDVSLDSGEGSNSGGMAPELELYDGVPLVSLPHDEGVDVEELLLAVYDRLYVSCHL